MFRSEFTALPIPVFILTLFHQMIDWLTELRINILHGSSTKSLIWKPTCDHSLTFSAELYTTLNIKAASSWAKTS